MTELWDSRSYWNHRNAAPAGSITFWRGRENTGAGGGGRESQGRDKALGRVRHGGCAASPQPPPPSPASPVPSPGSASPSRGPQRAEGAGVSPWHQPPPLQGSWGVTPQSSPLRGPEPPPGRRPAQQPCPAAPRCLPPLPAAHRRTPHRRQPRQRTGSGGHGGGNCGWGPSDPGAAGHKGGTARLPLGHRQRLPPAEQSQPRRGQLSLWRGQGHESHRAPSRTRQSGQGLTEELKPPGLGWQHQQAASCSLSEQGRLESRRKLLTVSGRILEQVLQGWH